MTSRKNEEGLSMARQGELWRSETTPTLNSQRLYVSSVKQLNSEQIDLKAYAICYN